MKITDSTGKTVSILIYAIDAYGMPGCEITEDVLDDVYGCPTNDDGAHIVPDVDYTIDAARDLAEENGYEIVLG